jgi:hypothetical protein
MQRTLLNLVCLSLLLISWMKLSLSPATASQSSETARPGSGISGQGNMRFRVLYTSDHLPPEAQSVLKGAHGGFTVDLRPGKGETYFSLKGAGILRISSDLKSVRLLNTAPEMKNTNLHNTTIWQAADGTPLLSFPGNEAGAVFTTTIDGKLLHTLKAPEQGSDVGHPTATDYFGAKGNFVPTDVEQLDGVVYMTTGYSKLDFVLTARVASTKPLKLIWHDLAFGGRGSGPGQFGTGHGITVPPRTKRLDIADRPNSEIDRFTRHGHYLSTLRLPQGSFPCDIYYLGNYAVVGALHGPDRTKGAPIYILENDQLISTIMPKEELGLKNFQHVHNAVLREHGGKLYVIAQAWNPGDFAILEQVSE